MAGVRAGAAGGAQRPRWRPVFSGSLSSRWPVLPGLREAQSAWALGVGPSGVGHWSPLVFRRGWGKEHTGHDCEWGVMRTLRLRGNRLRTMGRGFQQDWRICAQD